MTKPQHAGALHWQEAQYWRICAAMTRNDSQKRHYERLAREATQDQRAAEATKTKGQQTR